MTESDTFPTARFIKEIGRGKNGARSLSQADAAQLYAAMLAGRVADLELGAILMAMRIKGETAEEIAGFLMAAEASLTQLTAPAVRYAPVVIPSYNGARNLPNLTPLLAALLAREGVPVLVHGVLQDPTRVTTAEIMQELGLPPCQTILQAEVQLAQGKPAFLPIEILAPQMAHLLSLRRILGVRSSTHTLVKILQPFAGPALRLNSYTHPEYLEMLGTYFMTLAPAARGDIFLMRGTEGETVAHPKRAQQIDWFHHGERSTLVEKQDPVDEMPPLPGARDAITTAQWITEALAGQQPIPLPILQQVEQCRSVSERIQATIAL